MTLISRFLFGQSLLFPYFLKVVTLPFSLLFSIARKPFVVTILVEYHWISSVIYIWLIITVFSVGFGIFHVSFNCFIFSYPFVSFKLSWTIFFYRTISYKEIFQNSLQCALYFTKMSSAFGDFCSAWVLHAPMFLSSFTTLIRSCSASKATYNLLMLLKPLYIHWDVPFLVVLIPKFCFVAELKRFNIFKSHLCTYSAGYINDLLFVVVLFWFRGRLFCLVFVLFCWHQMSSVYNWINYPLSLEHGVHEQSIWMINIFYNPDL